MMRVAIALFLLGNVVLPAQTPPTVFVEPHPVSGLPGLQAYACGTYQGKWMVMGGRTDGLHRRQPNFSFDIPGHNTNIYLIDPQNAQGQIIRSLPLSSLKRNGLRYELTHNLPAGAFIIAVTSGQFLKSEKLFIQ